MGDDGVGVKRRQQERDLFIARRNGLGLALGRLCPKTPLCGAVPPSSTSRSCMIRRDEVTALSTRATPTKESRKERRGSKFSLWLEYGNDKIGGKG